jgi:hypothetical protein
MRPSNEDRNSENQEISDSSGIFSQSPGSADRQSGVPVENNKKLSSKKSSMSSLHKIPITEQIVAPNIEEEGGNCRDCGAFITNVSQILHAYKPLPLI